MSTTVCIFSWEKLNLGGVRVIFILLWPVQCKSSEIGTCNLNFGCMECLKDFLFCDSHCYLQSKDFFFTIVPQPKNSSFILLWWLLVWLTGGVIAPLVVVFVDEMQTAISTRTTRIVVIMLRPQEAADSSSISPPAPRHCLTLVSNHSNQNWPITLSTQNQHFSILMSIFHKVVAASLAHCG